MELDRTSERICWYQVSGTTPMGGTSELLYWGGAGNQAVNIYAPDRLQDARRPPLTPSSDRTSEGTRATNRTKHGALRPQKPLRLIRDGEVGGSGIFISDTYSLHCLHQNDSALRRAVV